MLVSEGVGKAGVSNPLANQSCLKKGRNSERVDLDDGSMAMDADCNEGKDDLSHSRGHPVESMNGEKALFPLGSYSSKVAGKETKGSGFLEEEDVCTSIQRQTKNGPVLMKPGVRNEANAAPKVSESELYGPRMVVGDKRRRSMASNPQVMANKSSVEVPGKGMSNSIATRLYKGSSSQSAAGGSHFTILSEESGSGNPDIDCMDVVNQLPLDANPDKRMKTPIVSTQDARVVPMVEGTCTSVVAHTTKTQAGSYVAVTLVEEGDKQVVSARLKHIKSKITAAKKGVKEAIKKPRVGKKSNVAKGGASRPKFIEWTQTFSKQLEVDRGDSSSGYDSSNINAENVLVEKDSLVVAGKVGAVKDITHHTLGLVDSCDATGEL
ncbi:hypothetical protein V6N13_101143 [Hibiscus sabdariffa]